MRQISIIKFVICIIVILLSCNTAKAQTDSISHHTLQGVEITGKKRQSWVNLSWAINMVGDRYSLPENINANLIKGYSDQQLTVSKSIKLKNVGLRLQAEVLNLFDERYGVLGIIPCLDARLEQVYV